MIVGPLDIVYRAKELRAQGYSVSSGEASRFLETLDNLDPKDWYPLDLVSIRPLLIEGLGILKR